MTKTLTEQQIRKIIENVTGKAAKVCEQKFYGKPKSLTEQWREGKLPIGKYYIKTKWWGCDGKWHYEKEEDIDYLDGDWRFYQDDAIAEVLGPVPSYQQLYGPNDGRIPVGLFTVLKLIKRDIEQFQKIRHLTDLECGIKSQVVSLLKRWGWDLGKDGLVSNSDELPTEQVLNLQKMVEDECSRRCELETKCSQLEKRLEVSEKEHYRTLEQLRIATKALKDMPEMSRAQRALREMEGVK